MASASEPKRIALEKELQDLDQQLRAGLQARGFDPEQHDNLALTAPLAKLYAEREKLRDELQRLIENDST